MVICCWSPDSVSIRLLSLHSHSDLPTIPSYIPYPRTVSRVNCCPSCSADFCTTFRKFSGSMSVNLGNMTASHAALLTPPLSLSPGGSGTLQPVWASAWLVPHAAGPPGQGSQRAKQQWPAESSNIAADLHLGKLMMSSGVCSKDHILFFRAGCLCCAQNAGLEFGAAQSYLSLEKLGEGAFASVYKGISRSDGPLMMTSQSNDEYCSPSTCQW